MILITLKMSLMSIERFILVSYLVCHQTKNIYQPKKPKGHKFKFKLQELINIIQQDKTRYERRLGLPQKTEKIVR